MAMSSNANSIPQGFSIFQPALGAQLQFFPAVGSKELDDMINAYIPGPASIQEKRASVAVDFLEYTQLTGQTFKFYQVYVESPVSSFTASPAASAWDWSQSSPSQSSAQPAHASRKASSSAGSSVSRHQTADFSHLPGMKIMTKDGLDVTNSASRGSKTKEQRDHAHLMRIIKACDSCRRKKIRCDPSHKKRGASQAQSSPPSRSAKKAKPAAVSQPPPVVDDASFPSQSLFEFEPSFTFADLEVPELSMAYDPMDEFVEQPGFIAQEYDFFFDPQGYLSPETSLSSSSSTSASPSKILSSSFQSEAALASVPGVYNDNTQSAVFESPGESLDLSDSANSYADFNLYSPASSFSEDERMVSIEESSERFSAKSQSLSPLGESQSSPGGSSHNAPWDDPSAIGDISHWPMPEQAGLVAGEALLSEGESQEYYDALCCFPLEHFQASRVGSGSSPGVSNAELIELHEPATATTTDGALNSRPLLSRPLLSRPARTSQPPVQTETHSSTTSSGDSSISCEHSVSEPGRERLGSVEAVSRLRNAGFYEPAESPQGSTTASEGINVNSPAATPALLRIRPRIQPRLASSQDGLASGDLSPGHPSSVVQSQPLAVSSGVQTMQPVQDQRVLATSAYTAQNVLRLSAVEDGVPSVRSPQPNPRLRISQNLVPQESRVSGQTLGQEALAVFHRALSGVRRPDVGSMAPLSSPAFMLALVLLVILAWTLFSNTTVVSMVLCAAPLGLGGYTKIASKRDALVSELSGESTCGLKSAPTGTGSSSVQLYQQATRLLSQRTLIRIGRPLSF